jgi:hypothetical protein
VTAERSFWAGARLGLFQAHALCMTPAGIAMFTIGAWPAGVLFLFGGLFGWYVWWADYHLAWKLPSGREVQS